MWRCSASSQRFGVGLGIRTGVSLSRTAASECQIPGMSPSHTNAECWSTRRRQKRNRSSKLNSREYRMGWCMMMMRMMIRPELRHACVHSTSAHNILEFFSRDIKNRNSLYLQFDFSHLLHLLPFRRRMWGWIEDFSQSLSLFALVLCALCAAVHLSISARNWNRYFWGPIRDPEAGAMDYSGHRGRMVLEIRRRWMLLLRVKDDTGLMLWSPSCPSIHEWRSGRASL